MHCCLAYSDIVFCPFIALFNADIARNLGTHWAGTTIFSRVFGLKADLSTLSCALNTPKP